MALADSLRKVETVSDRIITSNRDIGYLNVFDTTMYIPVGGRMRIPMDTDAAKTQKINYTSSNENVASVEDGIITGHSAGTATITISSWKYTATYTAHVGYEIYDTSAIPQQTRTVDEIVIVNPKATLEAGDEWALYAVGVSNSMVPKYDISYYNPIKFTSSNPEIATVMFGTLMANKPGTCTITATDLNENASASFTLTVTEPYVPTATSAETYTPTIDNTGTTDVTAAIAQAFAYASEHNYKKISFPYGTYLMNGDNRPNNEPILIPSNMIIDFNGSKIFFDDSSAAVLSGYNMFYVYDIENTWIRNVSIYAENYGRAELIMKEADRILVINGDSRNVHFENCYFGYSPGVNVGISLIWNLSFQVAWLKLNNIEAGGIDANGNNISQSGAFRTKTYFGGATEEGTGNSNGYSGYVIPGDGWTFGNYLSYRMRYIRSRLYDVYFYDENKTFMYRRTNCYTEEWYPFDTNYPRAYYYRVVFYQADAPTEEDENDYGGVAWLEDTKNPKDIYFKDCTFERAQRVGLSPQGGVHVVVDRCLFKNNGTQDPFSHIDWEDGRQSIIGHIVRNCKFEREITWSSFYAHSQIINGYARNITFHDNYVKNSLFSSWSENTMGRVFHNVFEGSAVQIATKMDAIFAGNASTNTPTYSEPDVEGTYNMHTDNEIITVE